MIPILDLARAVVADRNLRPSHGTVPSRVPWDTSSVDASASPTGTDGTTGTNGPSVPNGPTSITSAQRISDLAGTWLERIAIIIADAPDVSEVEARSIADAEIGRQFVAVFMSDEVP